MAVRIALRPFQTVNPLYAGATLTLFTVNASGVKTAVKATLYGNPTGATLAANPQTLDSLGKLVAPIYHEVPVIGTITGLGTVDNHDTAICPVPGNYRGDWVTATFYVAGDIVRAGAAADTSGDILIVEETHTSGTYAADVSATKLTVMIDVSLIADLFSVPGAGGNALKFLRVNAGASAYELISAATVLSAIGAAAAAHNHDATYARLAAANTFTDVEMIAMVLRDYGEKVNAIGSIGGGTQDIDLTLGNVVSGTVDTSTTTFTFSNPSPTGIACSFTLILTNGGSQTINWPASVKWPSAVAPSLTASGVDLLTFLTTDAGTTWRGTMAMKDVH